MTTREYVCTFVNGELVPMSELVRCRDCKHCNDEGVESHVYFCLNDTWNLYPGMGTPVKPDDFCSRFEAREDA